MAVDNSGTEFRQTLDWAGQRGGVFADIRPRISLFSNAFRYITDGEPVRPHPARTQFVPRQWGGDGSTTAGSHRVRGCGGLRVRVSHHVDIDPVASLVLRCSTVRCAGSSVATTSATSRANCRIVSKSGPRFSGATTCSPREPVVFRYGDRPRSLSTSAHARAAARTKPKSSLGQRPRPSHRRAAPRRPARRRTPVQRARRLAAPAWASPAKNG
jgi:hypothetical protein